MSKKKTKLLIRIIPSFTKLNWMDEDFFFLDCFLVTKNENNNQKKKLNVRSIPCNHSFFLLIAIFHSLGFIHLFD